MIYGFDEGQVLVIRPVKFSKRDFRHKYTIEIIIALDPKYRKKSS